MKHIGPLVMVVLICGLLSCAVVGGEIGPDKGHLIVVGGAMRDPAILEKFFKLAGGKDAPIVVIPTAGGRDDYGPAWRGLNLFKSAGATDVTLLHTYDPKVADTEEFVAPLKRAKGVWFGGGRQWRLADSYLNTRTHKEFWNVLDRGGVIGGSSAGATIQGSYLVRGDTAGNRTMMGDHEVGLGFLKNVGIDQHLLRRNRHFDMIEVISAHPELLGIGIDENTAIVVTGDQFEVMGAGYVVNYDHERQVEPHGEFYFVAPGDRYDMKAREAVRPGRQGEQPAERVQKKSWN